MGRQAVGVSVIKHAWRVEVAHGRLGRSRGLVKSFENATASATGWLQVAIAATLRHLPQPSNPAARVLQCRVSNTYRAGTVDA
jgi:rhamnogalacturonyl hydrolase YesR